MKLNINKLKKVTSAKINFFSNVSKNAYSSSSEAISDGFKFTKKSGAKFKEYMISAEYEADLDETIENIYSLNPFFDVPKFESTSRKKRIGMKTKFLLKQSTVFIAATGTIGAKAGSYIGTPHGVAAGGTIGSGVGAAAILFIAVRVVFRRFSGDENTAGLVPA
jgi:hypothetical protein